MALGAIAVGPVAGPVELGQLKSIDVQQRARFGPLVAPGRRRAFGAPLTADAVALEDLPDRRAMPAGQKLQLHRAVVGLLACGEDRPLGLLTQRPRARPRSRRPRA